MSHMKPQNQLMLMSVPGYLNLPPENKNPCASDVSNAPQPSLVRWGPGIHRTSMDVSVTCCIAIVMHAVGMMGCQGWPDEDAHVSP